MPSQLTVSEIFGPTYQGEGPSLGRRCVFLRLGGCNLRCRWCDTPYTWDWAGVTGTKYDPHQELRQISAEQAWSDLHSRGADMLVVSGGEPLLQQQPLAQLLELAHTAHYRIEIETAGTIAPTPRLAELVDQFNVSPKLAHSGNPDKERCRPQAIEALKASGKAIWKFVARGPEDLAEIGDIVERYGLAPVYVMAEGTDPETIAARSRELAEAVLARGWNLTTRLHILLYGNRRGI
ncbi:MAG TPA: radical SAM protein [Chloroflexota bacterium]|jgi:7-cyano-7-deazaguanosine (preQ0) biosynthesis protein QueE|nr:radical SAM protein [Chloroflexota bacterium]